MESNPLIHNDTISAIQQTYQTIQNAAQPTQTSASIDPQILEWTSKQQAFTNQLRQFIDAIKPMVYVTIPSITQQEI